MKRHYLPCKQFQFVDCMLFGQVRFGCLCGAVVGCRTRHTRSKGRWFDTLPGSYQVNWVNSAFHPSGVGKSSTSLRGWS